MAEKDDEDQDQKTEDPSQKRLDQARERGQASISKEVVNWFFMATCAVILIGIAPYMSKDFLTILTPFLGSPDQMILEAGALQTLSLHLFKETGIRVAIPLLIMCFVIVGVGLMQVRSSLSLSTLKPKMSRLSPKQGFKKIFSKKAVVDFIKTFFKTVILLVALYMLFKNHAFEIKTWTHLTLQQMFLIGERLLLKLFLALLIILFFLALADFIYQQYEFKKGLRMTKQEVKDEYKDSEGDPAIKQRIRRLRMERSQNRMMQSIPEATVVITNPTHFSVVLKFDEVAMTAPRVVAKGQDHVAFLIREHAKKHNVPIVENPPVARDLFSRVEIDHEIPEDSYKAVAEIIRFVMKMKAQQF